MCWQCDNPDKTIDDYLDILRETIRTHGWAVQFVEDDRRPFAYTIGLHDRAMPELMVTGLQPYDATRLLNWAAAHIGRGLDLTSGEQFTDPGGRSIEVVEVDHPDAHLNFAIALCGPNVRALQLVWADTRGRWPWDARWAHGRWRQPVVGMRARAA